MKCCFFFFQAEDGIRDHCVTGVQTCALPIYACMKAEQYAAAGKYFDRMIQMTGLDVKRVELTGAAGGPVIVAQVDRVDRSEERRVGKECRSRWSPYH